MPKNKNFTLMDTGAKPVYATLGVLMSAQGTDQRANVKPILGAYYNTLEQDAGLYIPLPDGSFDYFDIEIQDLVAQGDSRLVRFDSDGVNYLMRPLYEEDGEWLSKYKIALPKSALEKMITLQSQDAIEKFADIELGEPIPFFEGLYCYYLIDSPVIMSIIYMSSAGIFVRQDGQWMEEEAFGTDLYTDMPSLEIEATKAKILLDEYDKNKNSISVKRVKELSVKPE